MTTPDPPLRCLATLNTPEESEQAGGLRWWSVYKEWFTTIDAYGRLFYANPRELTVVPHPRNDPEAVAMIEKAKR